MPTKQSVKPKGVAGGKSRAASRSVSVFERLYQDDMDRRSRHEFRRQQAANQVEQDVFENHLRYMRTGDPRELEHTGERLHKQASERELRRLERQREQEEVVRHSCKGPEGDRKTPDLDYIQMMYDESAYMQERREWQQHCSESNTMRWLEDIKFHRPPVRAVDPSRLELLYADSFHREARLARRRQQSELAASQQLAERTVHQPPAFSAAETAQARAELLYDESFSRSARFAARRMAQMQEAKRLATRGRPRSARAALQHDGSLRQSARKEVRHAEPKDSPQSASLGHGSSRAGSGEKAAVAVDLPDMMSIAKLFETEIAVATGRRQRSTSPPRSPLWRPTSAGPRHRARTPPPWRAPWQVPSADDIWGAQ